MVASETSGYSNNGKSNKNKSRKQAIATATTVNTTTNDTNNSNIISKAQNDSLQNTALKSKRKSEDLVNDKKRADLLLEASMMQLNGPDSNDSDENTKGTFFF